MPKRSITTTRCSSFPSKESGSRAEQPSPSGAGSIPADMDKVRFEPRRVTVRQDLAVVEAQGYIRRGSLCCAAARWRSSSRASGHSVSERITNPVLSLGMKKVDVGGISRPSRAVRSISATLTGRISTAADARPLSTSPSVSSSPCW